MAPENPITPQEPRFSVARSLKLGTFHVGSSLSDVLLSGVWNRVMISDLGVAGWPVGLLLALRYFLAPVGLWAGHRSDSRVFLGKHRTGYIWLGRLMMLVALPLLPLSVFAIASNRGSAAGWFLAVVAFLLHGTGTSISGAPYVALVHDSAPYERRGQAYSITQAVLVISFAFVGVLYGGLMPEFSEGSFWRLVIIGSIGAALFWFLSIWREERPARPEVANPAETPSLRETLRIMLAESRTRRYAVFLGVSAFFAFMQDAVLEPFGGDVFGLPAGETTRFAAYWGSGVIVGMVLTYILTRKRRPDQQVSTTAWGLAFLGIPVLLLGFTGLREIQSWLVPVLVLFGLGFGVFTVGGVSLLMAMSTARRAGSYLALWSVIQLLARGAGIAAGGLMRDIGLAVTGQISTAYAVVFFIEGLGLLLCILLLLRVDIAGFAREHASDLSGVEPLTPSLE